MQQKGEGREDIATKEDDDGKPLKEEEEEDDTNKDNKGDSNNMTERVKGVKGEREKRTNVTPKVSRPNTENQRVLVKFEIDKKNEEDAIKMSKIISRAANLKKDSTHYVAKFLFEECIAEYRAANMLG